MEKYAAQYVNLSRNIRFYRKLARLTQSQLAEMADISTGWMGHIESESMITPVSLQTIFAIAEALGIHESKLFEKREL